MRSDLKYFDGKVQANEISSHLKRNFLTENTVSEEFPGLKIIGRTRTLKILIIFFT